MSSRMAAFWADRPSPSTSAPKAPEPGLEDEEDVSSAVAGSGAVGPRVDMQPRFEVPLVNAAAVLTGSRPSMEDRHSCLAPDLARGRFSLFGVYDGHAGSRCAEFLAHTLGPVVATALETPAFAENPDKVLCERFLALDEQFCQFANHQGLQDGSSALLAVVERDPVSGLTTRAWFANSGDSRAIVVRRSGTVKQMNRELSPYLADERKRVEDEGGFIKFVQNAYAPMQEGTMRVNGVLAMTRAFGNYSLKPFVTAKPEVTVRNLRKDDQFICLASDGLWETVSNDEAGEYLLKFGAATGAQRLAQLALQRGSMDNITVLAVRLNAGVSSEHLPH
jgi:protein phosphatase 1L